MSEGMKTILQIVERTPKHITPIVTEYQVDMEVLREALSAINIILPMKIPVTLPGEEEKK